MNDHHIATIVAALIASRHGVSLTELRDIVTAVRRAFDPEPIAGTEASPAPTKKTTREVNASIQPDGLISFEDGRKYKMLKRHISRLGMTPAEYREKHGLPLAYPMVAPEYSRSRSALAKKFGLGTIQR